MGRGFTSIPQRQATPEPVIPVPPSTGSVLGTAVMIGPLETQEFTSEEFENILLFPAGEAHLIANSLGLKFDEFGALIFPEDGVYIVTLSVYPVYNRNNEYRNALLINTSTHERSFFDIQPLNVGLTERMTGEQITALIQINGGSKTVQFEFKINKVSKEEPVFMIVEELMVVGFT